uniref:HAD family hydrolase n=2 Tax=Flavobacterium sp. TaxID=239 RepID=UPI00404B9230
MKFFTMRRAILFDLDDTLIDTRLRHYEVVRSFLANSAVCNILDFAAYCTLRQKAVKNEDIVNKYLSSSLNYFHQYWHYHIESPEFLLFDEVIVDEKELLMLKQRGDYSFILISLRSNTRSAVDQFNSFAFSNVFDEFFFLPHNKANNPKTNIITGLKNKYLIHSFIGDAPSDFDSAQKSGINFIGVETGWYSSRSNTIYPSINEIISNL